MPANLDLRKMMKPKEIQERENVEYSLNGLVDHKESENTWIKLHQMFDK